MDGESPSAALAEASKTSGDAAPAIVMLSLTRQVGSALIARGNGASLTAAVVAAAEELHSRAFAGDLASGRLKLDVAIQQGELEQIDGRGRARLDPSLDGLWLARHDLLFLPGEMSSRRLLNESNDPQTPRVQEYLKHSGRQPLELDENPAPVDAVYRRVMFHSVMEGPDGQPIVMYRGNPLEPDVSPDGLLRAAHNGGDYLLRHLLADATFGYSYEPQLDEYAKGYNLLRHAGTCYALLELQLVLDREQPQASEQPYAEGARRALEQLLATHVQGPKPEDAATDFEAIVSPGEQAKLGGAALAVLALLRYEEVTGDGQFRPHVEKLAKFMVFQQEESGSFASKYHYGEPDAKPFVSIYYPGEAILSLARLAKVDPAGPWLETARKGADWLIDVRDAGKKVSDLPHDHWLLMALDELDQLTADERYAAHATKIAEAIITAQRLSAPYPDWVGTFYTPPRSTPAATRAEALVAMSRLARRTGRDDKPYINALRRMAAFQLRCQITPENALYLPAPQRALGGFRRGLTDWEVRIDYVQHNMSALLGLRSLELEGS